MNDDSMTIGIEAEMVTMTKTLMRIASALERIADMVELKDADGNLRGIPIDISVRGSGSDDGESFPVRLITGEDE